MFDALGRPLADLLADHRILIPRTTLTINYKSPSRFNDLLELGLGIDSLSERRVRLAFQMRHQASGKIVAEGTYEIACADEATFKGRPFPGEVRALFDAALTRS
jgi:acyl-CoA thioesterase FadM